MLVEIWSDVVCPWCAIGKARFERALARFEHRDDIQVRWRSFELDPERRAVPGADYVDLLARKYRVEREHAQAMIDEMVGNGRAEGIEFRFDLATPGNTFDAHRLLHLAADRDLQDQVKSAFLDGYHSKGVPIEDHGALRELAAGAGLDPAEVTEVLRSDAYAAAVREDEATAQGYGIRGVPFFVFDRHAGVSGAQASEYLLAALREVYATRASRSVAAPLAGTDTHAGHDHAPGEPCVAGACAI